MGVAAADGRLIRQGAKGGGRQDADLNGRCVASRSFTKCFNRSSHMVVIILNLTKYDNRELIWSTGSISRPPSTPSDCVIIKLIYLNIK
jgi:hypothetical protein